MRLSEEELESRCTEFNKAMDAAGYAVSMVVVEKRSPEGSDGVQTCMVAHLDGVDGRTIVKTVDCITELKTTIMKSTMEKFFESAPNVGTVKQ